jgi:hypothetical protein
MRVIIAVFIVTALCIPSVAGNYRYVNPNAASARDLPGYGNSPTDSPLLSPSFAVLQCTTSTAAAHDTIIIYAKGTAYTDICYISAAVNRYIDFVGVDYNGDSATFGDTAAGGAPIYAIFMDNLSLLTNTPFIIKNFRFTNFLSGSLVRPILFNYVKSTVNPGLVVESCIFDSMSSGLYGTTSYLGAINVYNNDATTNKLNTLVKKSSFYNLHKMGAVFTISNNIYIPNFTMEQSTVRSCSNVFGRYAAITGSVPQDDTAIFRNCIIANNQLFAFIRGYLSGNIFTLSLTNCDTFNTNGIGKHWGDEITNIIASSNIYSDPLFDTTGTALRYSVIPTWSPCATASDTGGYIGYWNPTSSTPEVTTVLHYTQPFIMRWRSVMWRVR